MKGNGSVSSKCDVTGFNLFAISFQNIKTERKMDGKTQQEDAVLWEGCEGYEYDFHPILDPKYECPICLLCQREPTQTTCGHRFCRACILTWIRMKGRRCPEDNSPITEQDLFPDNFAKREILSLTVWCPNKPEGCNEKSELGKVEDHVLICGYQMTPCPNDCSATVLRRDMDNHKANDCLSRTIPCKLCDNSFPLKEQQNHFATCPMVTVPCPHCQEVLPRRELPVHLQADCPKERVFCPYFEFGCKEKVERSLMAQHQETSMQQHLLLVSAAVQNSRLTLGNMLSRRSDSSPPTSIPSLKEMYECYNDVPKGAEYASYNKFHDGGAANNYDDYYPNSLAYDVSPHAGEKSECGMEGPCMDPFEKGLAQTPNLLRDLFQRTVQLEQKAREQELKLDALRQRVVKNERLIQTLMVKQPSMESRFCNGIYFWNVPCFNRLREEASKGHNRVIHSPGFYTSCFGYCVCLRLNVQSKDGSTFVSLFIHLMQGEFDDMLDWPFSGKITLSILDQEDRSENKLDITETMHTKQGLTAFRRPTSERNPRGFGYTEFISVDSLMKGPYLKNDTLVIKAVVTV